MAPWFSKKKSLAVVLAVSLSMVLAACPGGEGGDEEEEEEDSRGRRQTPVVRLQY